MKRTIAALMAVALSLSGCAASLPVGGVRSSLGSYARRATARQQQAEERQTRDTDAWTRYLSNLPVGSKVKVTTVDGKSFKGFYMGFSNGRADVRPRTRIPEAVRSIPIDSLVAVDLDQGTNVGKVVAIAAGVAGATVLGIFLILFGVYGD